MQQAPIPTAVDLKGLAELKQRAAREDPGALAEAAVQFEALFIGLMLKTARDANLGEGMFDSDQSRQYLDLMDSQVALDLARKGGFGLGKLIVDQLAPGEAPRDGRAGPFPLGPRGLPHAAPGTTPGESDVGGAFPLGLPPSLRSLAPSARLGAKDAGGAADAVAARAEARTADAAGTPESFVTRFLDEATAAANALGIEPRLLLAQAALETGWGGAVPAHADGRAANNLFGIKANASWRGARVAQWTLEHSDGGAMRKREEFRAYPHTSASFADYVNLIANTPRYAAALQQAHDPDAYARAVTEAGYATDPAYAEKWLSIYHGDKLGGALRELKPADLEPTQ